MPPIRFTGSSCPFLILDCFPSSVRAFGPATFPVGEGEKRPRRDRGRRDAYFFLSSLFILLRSFVGISSSTVGIRIRQMKAAVRPPLYRQKPP